MDSPDTDAVIRKQKDIFFWKIRKLSNSCFGVKHISYAFMSLYRKGCGSNGQCENPMHDDVFEEALKKLVREYNTIPQEIHNKWRQEYEKDKLASAEQLKKNRQDHETAILTKFQEFLA
jgi:hypothetical protein